MSQFDDLGNSAGTARSLPNGGYDYNGLEMRENSWRWVSKGLQYNGDWTADDRPVPRPENQQQSNVTTHSGNNALMNVDDGWGYSSDRADYSGGHRYYDPKSLWIAPEYENKAFAFRMSCESYNAKDNRDKTWQVPALPRGQFYKVVIPTDWVHMWRCRVGATNLQQVVIDDLEYCLWDFPYAVPIPW